MELLRRRKGHMHLRQSFAGIFTFQATRKHLFAFSWLSFSSDTNTYFWLVRWGNLHPNPLGFQAPELWEGIRINKASWCQQAGTLHLPCASVGSALNTSAEGQPSAHQLLALMWTRLHLEHSSETCIAPCRGSIPPAVTSSQSALLTFAVLNTMVMEL